ncbi:hypothetical protein RUMHYD_03928 [Blautia hydrogenotrophica DSM 10507]|uniref:Uncharacterized protein n=1 Tax=Blautia hydrogenotrophica (strain DSM 10507 / JCM 14656 / S5a33) TaxID=476272 RepID=C0CSQ2_BLAHS|nr:hypothetical protein RUMHYD_03928 [Blautia hydrogenotrophica DSM 10507]
MRLEERKTFYKINLIERQDSKFTDCSRVSVCPPRVRREKKRC